MMLVRLLVLGILVLVLAAGAAAARAPVPTDFPFRGSDQPPFVVAWGLAEAPGTVSATGVLDIDGYVDRLEDATVELVGLDTGGRVLSRDRIRLIPRAFTGDRLWPFRLRLAPSGGEMRFAV